MEWICKLIEPPQEQQDGNNLTYQLITDNESTKNNNQETTEEVVSWTFLDYSRHIFVPLLCIIGILGNFLNMSILGKRIKEGVDTMEKGALVGMMALAASDFLFCVVTISGTYLPAQIIHLRRDLAFYNTLYGNCINNILIKTSTWFTVILAVSRHFAVAHPIKARQYMRCEHTVGAILLCVCLWIALHIPLAYLWNVQTVNCPNGLVFVLMTGKFQENVVLKSAFTYIWFVAGFAIPVLILAYCNIKLMHSLKISTTLRQNDNISLRSSIVRVKQKARDSNQRRISMTLIAIVTMFFLLIFPSEIAHFYEDIAKPGSGFKTVQMICNLLQVVNFAANFILYCIVNAYFRKTLRSWIMYLSCRKGQFSFRGMRQKGPTYSVTMSTKHSIVAPNSITDNGLNQSRISL